MRWFHSVAVLLAVLLSITPAQAQKKRVAVLDFEYAAVHDSASALFGTRVDVGKGIRDLLVEKLVQGNTYSVIDRAAMDKILTEQNFSNSDRVNPASAAKLGQVLGVDAIIIGSITQFGRDDKSTTVGGGGFGGFGARLGLGGVKKQNAKAAVGVTARLIDINTAEILTAITAKGESKREGTSLVGAGAGGGAGGVGGVDMSSSNFGETLIGEAVHEAVNGLKSQLEQGAGNIATRKVVVEGLVADASGNTLILNVGTKGGVKVGDRLQIRRATREIKDPASGKVIRVIEDSVGEVVITEADEVSSVGTFTGAAPAKVGDRVASAQ
jgi:curli biogenesis system outer membrane secretion channel CsgG